MKLSFPTISIGGSKVYISFVVVKLSMNFLFSHPSTFFAPIINIPYLYKLKSSLFFYEINGIMMKLINILTFLLISFICQSQINLEKLGQTPGGSGYHVNYDSASKKLFVGCGGTVRMYDATVEDSLVLIGYRPFFSVINETYVDGDILFVAANHDGFWALDHTQPELPILGHYPTPGDSAAFDIDIYNDTLYFANRRKAIELTFSTTTGFHKIREFGTANVYCVERRNNLIAVGNRIFLAGKVDVFDVDNVNAPLGSYQHNLIAHLEDLQFADLNDSIIYLCGGNSGLATKGEFWAFQYTGTSLDSIGRYTIDGFIPGIASANIMNMDSRNDTLYLATMAGLYNLETDVPVLDATGLPNNPLEVIGHIRPGLWHFDVSLADGTDYLAISSEWIGFVWRDLNNPIPWDTSEVYFTGGWGNYSRLRGDTLWVAMEGYGLCAYKLNDLLYTSGLNFDQELCHIFTQFVASFGFIDDTLVWLSNHEIYNLKPWLEGGQPELVGQAPGSGICTQVAETALGKRIVSSTYNVLWSLDIDGALQLYDPYNYPNYTMIHSKEIEGSPKVFTVEHDSVWVGAQINSVWSLAVYKIEADTFRLVAHTPAPGKVYSVSKDGNQIAVGCKLGGAAWYRFNGTGFIQEGSLPPFAQNIIDIKIKNNYLYVADRFDGLFVYDISQPGNPVLTAQSPGSGGWDGAYGTTGIDVGPDGKIYLTDFHVGTMIIEAVDSMLITGIPRPAYQEKSEGISVYPNPAGDYIIFDAGKDYFDDVQITVFDMTGKKIFSDEAMNGRRFKLMLKGLKQGVYIYKVYFNNQFKMASRFVKS
ncbi:MAG: T9SS type A sorting domain-containing protein [Bacteroidales bacterium]|nr:T9SS type A sorting domain-containing protein [Bacteroidales bacterium]MCF8454497.1 T9SS type A sorting domain-containing protein [Bacteroidales bacterium]